MTINKYNFPWQIIFTLFIFVVINLVMHVFSIDNASYTEGADASRYYNSALNIVSGRGLGDISYNGPIYPIYIAIHIYLFGESNVLTALVLSQSILLFLTGYIISILARNLKFSVMPLVVLLFVIINPNSLMIAHLVQTETLFTFLLTIYFFLLYKYFNYQKLQTLLIISLIAVLISLTRPAGMYVMALFSIITIPLLFKCKPKLKWLKHNIIYMIILAIGLHSIGMYNKKIHGEYFISANEGHFFHDQYVALLQFGNNLSASEALLKARNKLSNQINPNYIECVEKMTSIKCKDEVASIYINEIINENPLAIIKGFSTSITSLLFAGGASNFANYFGIDAKKHVIQLEQSEGGMFQIKKFINFLSNVNLKYLSALFIFWGWAIITKILMLIGFISEIKKGHKSYFFGVTIILIFFTAEYLFLGQSRWRAPFDPIFMMFSAVGFSIIFNKLKGIINQS